MGTEFSQEELERALDERRFGDLRAMISDSESADVAESIGALDPEKRTVVYRVLKRDLATEVFEHLDPEAQEELIKGLGREHVASIELGTDAIGYDAEIADLVAKEFAINAGRVVPGSDLVGALTALRKRGLLPQIEKRTDEDDDVGFDDIDLAR